MSSVKGSAQYRMVVMPYRPMRRVFNYFFGFLVVLFIVAASFFYGYDQGLNQHLSFGLPGKGAEEFARLQQEAESLRQEVTNLKLAAIVDQRAHEDVQRQTIEQRSQIAELERDIAVYRGMVAKSDGENPLGISVGAFQISGPGGVRGYKFKLVVQKLAVNDELFKGTLKVNIVGIRDGESITIPLHKASVQMAEEAIPISFKYFRSIEGDLLLPEGFRPERVVVAIKSMDSKKPTNVERQLDWSVAVL